jgi:hypothetical protein
LGFRGSLHGELRSITELITADLDSSQKLEVIIGKPQLNYMIN